MDSSVIGYAVIAATILGPIAAVLVTIFNDYLGRVRQEKMSIFKTLMSSRGNNQTVHFVDAINIIDVVFKGDEKVISLKNNFVSHRYTNPLENPDFWLRKDADNYNELLKSIAKNIGFNTDNIGNETSILKPKWLTDWNNGLLHQARVMEMLATQQSDNGHKNSRQHENNSPPPQPTTPDHFQ